VLFVRAFYRTKVLYFTKQALTVSVFGLFSVCLLKTTRQNVVSPLRLPT
jgi:hypothetical protein